MTPTTPELRPTKHSDGTIQRNDLQRLYDNGGHDHILKTLAAADPAKDLYKITTNWLLGDSTITVRGTHGDLHLEILD